MGQIPNDVDFATTATPDQMKKMFEREEIRVLNKGGEKHGTVTCHLNDKENFEITTLRIDKVCDGRRAEVEFTTDWFQDANRRDLTVNSMFLGLDGTLYDFFGGAEDLKNRRIVFVGDAALRIQEDYLRILRYFRFYERLAKSDGSHDQTTIQAIKENVRGLEGVSGERLWREFKEIIVGQMACSVTEIMLECGVGPYLGFPETPNIKEFRRVVGACVHYDPKPMTVLSGLLWTVEDLTNLDHRLKMSNRERFLAAFILQHRTEFLYKMEQNCGVSKMEQCFKNIIIDLYGPIKKLEAAEEFVYELIKYVGCPELLNPLKQWQAPRFPVDGIMLMQNGVRKGPPIRAVQSKLFEIWKESGCKEEVASLLSWINEFYKREKL